MFKSALQIKGDTLIWLAVLFLYLMSLLTVYSATGSLAIREQEGDTEFYLLKQFGMLIIGFGVMFVSHKVPYTYYSRFAQIALFFVVIPLLVITLIQEGELNGAKRFLPFLFGLTIQPSDLAKVALIIYLARVLAKKQDVIKSFRSGFLPIILPVLITCALIFPENFSTSAMLFACCLMLMFIGRIAIKYLLAMLGVGVLSIALFVGFAFAFLNGDLGRIGTWKSRIESFTGTNEQDTQKSRDANYQILQAKIAIANGGIFGKGPGNSQQKNFLPHPYSDFIYAIIIEEYGFAGAFFILSLYLIIFYRAIVIVRDFPKDFGALMAFGLSFLLLMQAMINMGVAVGLLPVTGQPLPLVSMGGTSTIITSLTVGIILSVSKEIGNLEEEKLEQKMQEASL